VLGVLAVAVLLIGLWPAPLVNLMESSVHHLLQQMLAHKIPVA
jgi:NADH-quinone oxidoreductase subunit M